MLELVPLPRHARKHARLRWSAWRMLDYSSSRSANSHCQPFLRARLHRGDLAGFPVFLNFRTVSRMLGPGAFCSLIADFLQGSVLWPKSTEFFLVEIQTLALAETARVSNLSRPTNMVHVKLFSGAREGD